MQVAKYRPLSTTAKVAGGSLLALGTALSHAALDAAVTTELTTAKADILAIGALVFAVAVGIVLFKWFKRAL